MTDHCRGCFCKGAVVPVLIQKMLLLTLLVVLLEVSDMTSSTDFLSQKAARFGSDVSNPAPRTHMFQSFNYITENVSHAPSADGRLISKNIVMRIVEECWCKQFVWLEVLVASSPSIALGTSIFWTFLALAFVQTGGGLI